MTRLPHPLSSNALLVGASSYSYLDDLPAVGNNLRGLRKALTDPRLSGFPSTRCTTLGDGVEVWAAYSALLKMAEATEDTLILYFSGHGWIGRRNELYLCLTGTDPKLLPASGLPYDWVRDALGDSQARNRVVILDCCFSGRAIPHMSGGEATSPGQIDIEGTYIITATAANALALAPVGATYTTFTGALLTLLENGVCDESGLLTPPTIYRHLRKILAANGFPQPCQLGTGTVDQLALTRNHAYSSSMNTLSTSDWIQPTVGIPSGFGALEKQRRSGWEDRQDELILVSGGRFAMGGNGYDNERLIHPVTLDDFHITRFPITVSNFQKFTQDTAYITDAEREGWSYVYQGGGGLRQSVRLVTIAVC